MRIAKVRDVKTPSRGTEASAGLDFYIPDDFEWISKTLRPGESVLIPSGIKAQVPKGHALIAFNKSGVAVKKGLQVGACVVDEDYQGEIHIHLINVSNREVFINRGDKITQFVLVPVTYDAPELVNPDELFENISNRGAGGFGSTGTT